MSNENETIKNETCFCKSEGFKKFVVVSLGTFVGGFCAISLFTALHKPPMMPMMPMMPKYHMGMQHMGGHHIKKHDCNCPCHKKMMKKHFENKAEFMILMHEQKMENKD